MKKHVCSLFVHILPHPFQIHTENNENAAKTLKYPFSYTGVFMQEYSFILLFCAPGFKQPEGPPCADEVATGHASYCFAFFFIYLP